MRVMAVVRVPASTHSSELRLFHIDAAGIRIGQRLADQEGILGGRPTRRVDRGQDVTTPDPSD